MTDVIQAIIRALLGGLVDAINAYRRDRDLERLGYTAAQRDLAQASLRQTQAVVEAQTRAAEAPRLDRAGTVERLRQHDF